MIPVRIVHAALKLPASNHPPPQTPTHAPSKSQGIAPSAKVSSDSACNFGYPFFSIPSDNDAMLEFSNSPLCPPNSVLIVLVCWLFDLPPKISDKKTIDLILMSRLLFVLRPNNCSSKNKETILPLTNGHEKRNQTIPT